MELKQLEYFLVAYEKGSLSKAAQALFTSQPNVSKVITALEKNLGYTVFDRTSKGLRLTQKGKSLHTYAKQIMKQIEMIENMKEVEEKQVVSIASYEDESISNILTDLYMKHPKTELRYYQGTVEEMIYAVENSEAEIGVLYLPTQKLSMFRHMLRHKHLEYQELGVTNACIYVGPKNPFYECKEIEFERLKELKFIRNTKDMFSIEYFMMQGHNTLIREEQFHDLIYTDSAYLTNSLLEKTDMCKLGGIHLHRWTEETKIRTIKVNDVPPFISYGYVYQKEQELSKFTNQFLQRFQ